MAERQYGVVHRNQALRAGLTLDQIAWRLRTRRWTRVNPCVYAVWRDGDTWRQRLWATALWLGPSAAFSHVTAVMLHGLDVPKTDVTHVALPSRARKRARTANLEIHQVYEWKAGEVVKLSGLRVTSVARTMIDLGAVVAREVVESVLEDALRRRRTTVAKLRRQLDRSGTRGSRGAGVLRTLLEQDRGEVTGSELELGFERLLRAHGFPIPRRQYRIVDGSERVARVDFAYPELKIAIEVDGFQYHGDRRAFQRDLERHNELVTLGWRVLRVTHEDIARRQEPLISRLGELRDGG